MNRYYSAFQISTTGAIRFMKRQKDASIVPTESLILEYIPIILNIVFFVAKRNIFGAHYKDYHLYESSRIFLLRYNCIFLISYIVWSSMLINILPLSSLAYRNQVIKC